MPHLDDPPIRPGALEAVMVAEPRAQPRELGLGVGIGAELSAAGQKADISLEIMRLGEEIVR